MFTTYNGIGYGHSELGSESFWGTVLTDSVSSPE